MCITFLFTNPGGSSIKYKLVLINNRDEFYARKTEHATLHSTGDLKTIYSTDLDGSVLGTWLGLSSCDGRIRVGNLANITGDEQNHKHGEKLGRGPIVTDFIKSADSFETYNKELSKLSEEFNSFNFLSVEVNKNDIKSVYISNTPPVLQNVILGFGGLGNSPMSTPFKKVEVGTKHFQEVLELHNDASQEDLIEALLAILKDETKYYPDAELLARRRETAEPFSSITVRLPGYGTRTRTVILVDMDNNVDYIEETMISEDPNGEWIRTHLKIPNDKSVPPLL